MDRGRGRSRERREITRRERFEDSSDDSPERRHDKNKSTKRKGSRERKRSRDSRQKGRHRYSSYDSQERSHDKNRSTKLKGSRERRRSRDSRQEGRYKHSSYDSRESKNDKNERIQNVRDKVRLVKLADKAKRYEDVFSIMCDVAKEKEILSTEERHLLWDGLRETVGPYRSAWRVTSQYQVDLDRHDDNMNRMVSKYKMKVASKVINFCRDSLELLDDVLIPGVRRNSKRNDTGSEDKVFYLKMKGDVYRYLCEVEDSDSQRRHARAAEDAYESAYKEAKEDLRSADPLRLGLALNYSVFHFEIMDDKKRALSLAQRALEGADHTLKKLDDSDYKEAKSILASLSENIEMWGETERRNSRSRRK